MEYIEVCRGGILRGIGTWDAEVENIEVWLPGMQRWNIKRNMYLGCRGGIFRCVGTWDAEVECTWDAEVEVAVAPPARKTFFCTFGAMSRLKKVRFMFSLALNMNS